MSNVVEKGDTVMLSYLGKLNDGQVFDKSDNPVSVEIGTGKLIQGLDREVIGMTEGEEKNVKISPEDGYGVTDPNLKATVSIDSLKENDIEPKVGMMLKTPQGNCHITDVSEEQVQVDFNHPLAGKSLVFDFKVEEIVGK